MGARRIIFLRHGQTDFNVQRRFQGIVNRPLNDVGRAQAQHAGGALASRLSEKSAQVGFTMSISTAGGVRMVASPLVRAYETAEIVHEALVNAGINCHPLESDPRLIERSYGDFEGCTIAEIQQKYPEELEEWRLTGESTHAQIEPSDRVGNRIIQAALDAVEKSADDETVVVVSHGSAITRGIITLLGLNPLNFDGLRSLGNCHWSEMVLAGGGGSGASGAQRWRLSTHNVGV